MRILIFHGYLLHGTGSNVYNAELGAALVRAGHELHLLCQDRSPLELDWVDAAGSWDSGSLVVEERRSPVRATVYRPDIGGVLPLYVADRYEGFDARPFNELSDDEVERYLAGNVAAVREVVARAGIEVALANHLVMGPAIFARAGLPSYAVKIHGSALEYTVKPYPRFKPFAVEGLAGARGVLVGSRHTAESLWAEMDDASVPPRTRLGPPGVDVARFAPRDAEAAQRGLEALRERLAALLPDAVERAAAAAASALATGAAGAPAAGPAGLAAAPAAPSSPADPASPAPPVAPLSPADPSSAGPSSADPAPPASPDGDADEAPDTAPPSSFDRDVAEAVAAIDTVEPGDRLIVFVGKLIASKGVELLLAAFPLVLAAEPRARLLIVGFGAFRPGLERLADQLAAGDLEAAAQTRAEDGRELPQLHAFLSRADDAYREAAKGLRDRVAWAGRLDHAELSDLLPAAEAMAVTSTFPEAFGMVAAEAAACGTLPVVANHSGLGEVARTLAEAVPPEAHPWLSFEISDEAVPQLAAALSGWLAAPDDLRAATRNAMIAATRARYSWEGVAATVIAAAKGELDDLPEPV